MHFVNIRFEDGDLRVTVGARSAYHHAEQDAEVAATATVDVELTGEQETAVRDLVGILLQDHGFKAERAAERGRAFSEVVAMRRAGD